MSVAEAEHAQLFCSCQSSQSNNLFQVTFAPWVVKQEVLPIVRETDCWLQPAQLPPLMWLKVILYHPSLLQSFLTYYWKNNKEVTMAVFLSMTSHTAPMTTYHLARQQLLTFEWHQGLPSSSSAGGPSSNMGAPASSGCCRRCNGKASHPSQSSWNHNQSQNSSQVYSARKNKQKNTQYNFFSALKDTEDRLYNSCGLSIIKDTMVLK